MPGTVWKYGDNVDTDLLAPGIYMKGPMAELATHCLEAIDLKFAPNVQPGDVIVAGRNFRYWLQPGAGGGSAGPAGR